MKGSGGLLLGVELVLQLHELSGSFDLVGNLLPLREETLALLKGQALRSVTGDGVLLLLTANPQMHKTLLLKHVTNISSTASLISEEKVNLLGRDQSHLFVHLSRGSL